MVFYIRRYQPDKKIRKPDIAKGREWPPVLDSIMGLSIMVLIYAHLLFCLEGWPIDDGLSFRLYYPTDLAVVLIFIITGAKVQWHLWNIEGQEITGRKKLAVAVRIGLYLFAAGVIINYFFIGYSWYRPLLLPNLGAAIIAGYLLDYLIKGKLSLLVVLGLLFFRLYYLLDIPLFMAITLIISGLLINPLILFLYQKKSYMQNFIPGKRFFNRWGCSVIFVYLAHIGLLYILRAKVQLPAMQIAPGVVTSIILLVIVYFGMLGKFYILTELQNLINNKVCAKNKTA